MAVVEPEAIVAYQGRGVCLSSHCGDERSEIKSESPPGHLKQLNLNCSCHIHRALSH